MNVNLLNYLKIRRHFERIKSCNHEIKLNILHEKLCKNGRKIQNFMSKVVKLCKKNSTYYENEVIQL